MMESEGLEFIADEIHEVFSDKRVNFVHNKTIKIYKRACFK